MAKPDRPDSRTGARVKARRLELELSQRALHQPGVSYAYVSRVEAGARTPSWQALIKIAERLKTTALALATGKADGPCPVCGRKTP